MSELIEELIIKELYGKEALEHYRKYVKEPRELIKHLNDALLLAKEGFISWSEYFKIFGQVMRILKEKYNYDIPSCFL